MAKPKSFEEFYYIKTGKNCNVKDVVDCANNNHVDYKGQWATTEETKFENYIQRKRQSESKREQ